MMQTAQQLIGVSSALRRLQEDLEVAARSDAKVLITGESGVGKEVVARLIHQRSARRAASLVTINCAGLPDTLLESELFGHVRGSFTGAYRDRPGLLEMANRGTIFMDEVGEMTLRMQALLLRFLETGEIQRVGSDRPQGRVDVPDLLDHFLQAYAERHGVGTPKLSPEALARLVAYRWGGNVRELKN